MTQWADSGRVGSATALRRAEELPMHSLLIARSLSYVALTCVVAMFTGIE